MGSQRYIWWNDAVHGYSSLWSNTYHPVSSNSALVTGIYLRKITSS